MNYGYFDDPNREYVITNPRTPAKWINYIGTLQFGGFVDHTGGAIICKNDPALKWDGFKARRIYRGATILMTVKNPNRVCKGVARVTVDGKQDEGEAIRADEGLQEVHVEMVMGS